MSAKQTTSKSINTKIARTLSADEILAGKEIKKVSSAAFSNWVRALLQNWRQGTVAVKGRAEVTYSGKKPWKQKGTGRARAGTRRSPLWRGGGVTFGPQKRVKKLKVSKKLKGRVLLQLLDDFLRKGKIVQLDWRVPEDKPSTKQAVNALKEANLIGEKVTLFLPHDDMVTSASFANLPNVNIIAFDQANAFDLSSAEYWVFLKKDLDLFKKMVEQWI